MYENDEVTRGAGKAVCRATLKEVRPGEAVVDQVLKFDLRGPAAAAVREASGKGAMTWDTERGLLKTLGASTKIVTIRGQITHTVTVALLSDPPAK